MREKAEFLKAIVGQYNILYITSQYLITTFCYEINMLFNTLLLIFLKTEPLSNWKEC